MRNHVSPTSGLLMASRGLLIASKGLLIASRGLLIASRGPEWNSVQSLSRDLRELMERIMK